MAPVLVLPKIRLLARVGKTSLLDRFVNQKFSEHKQKTINATFLPKHVELESGGSVVINVWVCFSFANRANNRTQQDRRYSGR